MLKWHLVLAATALCPLAGCQMGALPERLGFAKPVATPSKQHHLDEELAAAASLEREGQADRAISTYGQILEHAPDCVRAQHRLAVLASQQGRFDEAESYYRAALQRESKNAEILADFAYAQYLGGHLPQAEATLREALRADPSSARCRVNLGLALTRLGRQQEALDAFARAGCGEAQAHVNVGYVLLSQRKWPEAESHLAYAAWLDPSSKPAADGLAVLRTCQNPPNSQRIARDPDVLPTAYHSASTASPCSASTR